jgi:organic hydroperoxide reductase OsmC/OhrA
MARAAQIQPDHQGARKTLPVTVGSPEMTETAASLHPEGHAKCFIANSVSRRCQEDLRGVALVVRQARGRLGRASAG